MTQGSPTLLLGHLEALELLYKSAPASTPEIARANLDQYTQARIDTAEAILAHDDATPTQKRTALDAETAAWISRAEIDDDAIPHLHELTKRLQAEEAPGSMLPVLAAHEYLKSVPIRVGPGETSPPDAIDRYLQAALGLSRLKPPLAAAAQDLFTAAMLALDLGEQPIAVELCQGLATDYSGDFAGQLAQGVLNRLNQQGQVIELSGQDDKNEPISLKDFLGKVVIVVFWEAREGTSLYQLFKTRELLGSLPESCIQVFGVTSFASYAESHSHLESESMAWPMIVAPPASQASPVPAQAVAFGAGQPPLFLVVDREGRLRGSSRILTDLEPLIRSLCGENPEASRADQPATPTEEAPPAAKDEANPGADAKEVEDTATEKSGN